MNVNPTPELWNLTDWKVFYSKYSPFSATVDIPRVNIESNQAVQQQQMQTQQQIDQSRNFSLTLFVLFFASMDIAVTLYDHGDDDKDRTYRKNKSNQHKLTSQDTWRNNQSKKSARATSLCT
jgi:hypothetical protein